MKEAAKMGGRGSGPEPQPDRNAQEIAIGSRRYRRKPAFQQARLLPKLNPSIG
jgi:hypothetical protein